MTMFRKILVPVDMDSCHDRTVTLAAELASRDGAALQLVHVVEQLAGPADPDLEHFYRKLESKARDHLRDLWRRAGDPPVAHEERVILGHRVGAIIELVEKESFDLVVLSSHRIDRLRTVEATLSHLIAGLSPCDVLLVKKANPGGEP
jgi:nucleotide-binding universal stress UspA family protein